MVYRALSLAIVAAFTMGTSPALAQDPAALTIDNSILCAGLFFAHSQLPENASYPEGVENYRQLTGTFMRRAEILSERQGLETDTIIERIAAVTTTLIEMVDAAEGDLARMEVITCWNGAEDECIAGGQRPV